MLATLVIPLAGMKIRVESSAKRRLLDAAAWTEIPYAVFGVALVFGYMRAYIPFFYVPLFASEKIGVDKAHVVYMVVLLNTGSFFGRFVSAFRR